MAVDLSFFRSETAQKLRAEGRVEGEARGEVKSLLLILGQRGIAVPDDVREHIQACTDHDVLTTWTIRALTATTVGDLFDESENEPENEPESAGGAGV
ncbi:hypothetical protein [Streptomyces sp. NPDC048442]|uniref:hypothetical protein n=1 Tax=Streptomyces sp. NPDC048442 TaxID=3154823 RepID=UPI003421C903